MTIVKRCSYDELEKVKFFMNKNRLFAGIAATAAAVLIGLAFVGLQGSISPTLATTNKTYTFDATHGAPASNNSSYSTATGISSDVLMKWLSLRRKR